MFDGFVVPVPAGLELVIPFEPLLLWNQFACTVRLLRRTGLSLYYL